MRPHYALVLAILPVMLAAQAQAQTRYGPASPIASPAAADDIAPQTLLSWPGKTDRPTPDDTAAARPEPLSPWAKRQAAAPAATPVATTPAVQPARPQQAPVLRGASVAASAPQPAAAPSAQPPVAYSPPQQTLAAASAPRGFAGYGVPQITHYPGYEDASRPQPAPAMPAPRTDQPGLTLADPPTSSSLASPDDTNYQPKATTSQTIQSAN